jgi:signal peptidase I
MMRGFDRKIRSTLSLLVSFGIVAAAFTYSFRLVRVQGASMEPTFQPGQVLLVRRANWPAFPFHQDEVIVFRMGNDVLVKRIAALPGDLPPLDDLRVLRFWRPRQSQMSRSLAGEIRAELAPIPAEHVYVLGDNADRSEDSRTFGPIPLSAVIGRVVRWEMPDPPERKQIGFTLPRTHRALALGEVPNPVLAATMPRPAHPLP